MKSKSLFIVVLALFSVAVTVFGKEEPTKVGLAVIPVKGTEVFRVIYKGEATGKVRLNVYNNADRMVFTETLSRVDGFIRPLNFNGLPYGEYTVELIDATGTKVEKVRFSPNEKPVKNISVSKVANEESKFLVSVVNQGAEVINVKIYDGSNTLVYNESKEVTGNFAKLYAIKKLLGSFTFEITDKAGNSKVVTY